LLVLRSPDGGIFLRWFAQAEGFARLLENDARHHDDVVIFESGGVRVEVSLHDDPADCRRARDDVLREAKAMGALARAPTRGAA
jgi:hypothetical protein